MAWIPPVFHVTFLFLGLSYWHFYHYIQFILLEISCCLHYISFGYILTIEIFTGFFLLLGYFLFISFISYIFYLMNIYFYWYFSFLWYIFLYFLAYSVPLPFIFIETTNHLQDSSSYSWLLVFFRLLFLPLVLFSFASYTYNPMLFLEMQMVFLDSYSYS